MKNILLAILMLATLPQLTFAQRSGQNGVNQLEIFEDSLASLGKKIVNNESDVERKNANYTFIRTLVSALKIPNSFLYPFDSVKTISIVNSPDNRFRILTWFVANDDGSYRFYGAIQMNTGGKLLLYPLEDYTDYIKDPEEETTDNRKWFGAEYYRIIPVYSPKLYYVLLGWKGNTAKSTKKVIEVLSFKDDKPVLGLPVFEGNGKLRKRVVFEYTRMASMLLRYVPDKNLIVFDHLAPPQPKLKNQLDTYGPDLTYDGYELKDGRWVYVENLDMRNAPSNSDRDYIDPKKQAAIDRGVIR
jgi:hypothetical protein